MEQLPSASAANAAVRLVPPAAQAPDAWPHVAFLRMLSPTREHTPQHTAAPDDWLTCCYQFTPQMQRLSATAALLNLGTCTDAEAAQVVDSLLLRLAGMSPSAQTDAQTDASLDIQVDVQVGIAPTATLAQMAVLMAPSSRRITTLTPQDAPALLRRIPVTVLSRLLPSNTISPEIPARLQRYGLHTLGHLATLTERTLTQQFGSAGIALAALAQGRDPLPFTTTPLSPRLRFRMRFPATAVPAEYVLAALPAWTQQISRSLRDATLSVRKLRLVVGWEHGAYAAARTVLRQHTHDPALLHTALRGLLTSLLQPQHPGTPAPDDARDEFLPGASRSLLNTVRLTALDLAPLRPEQGTFWHMRAKQQAALGPVTDALARRHGRALVLCARPVATAAIFPEERYRLHTFECLPTTRAEAKRHTTRSSPSSSAFPASSSPAGLRIPARPSAWEDVPHRLHWW